MNASLAMVHDMPLPFDVSPSAMPQRHTLETLFRQPSATRLTWSDAVALFEILGEVERMANGQCMFAVAGERHRLRQPHGRDLSRSDMAGLRKFLQCAGWSAGGEVGSFGQKSSAPPLR